MWVFLLIDLVLPFYRSRSLCSSWRGQSLVLIVCKRSFNNIASTSTQMNVLGPNDSLLTLRVRARNWLDISAGRELVLDLGER